MGMIKSDLDKIRWR